MLLGGAMHLSGLYNDEKSTCVLPGEYGKITQEERENHLLKQWEVGRELKPEGFPGKKIPYFLLNFYPQEA